MVMSADHPGPMASNSAMEISHDVESGEGRSMAVPLQAPVAVTPNQSFDPVSRLSLIIVQPPHPAFASSRPSCRVIRST